MQSDKLRRIYRTLDNLANTLFPLLFWSSLIFGFDSISIGILSILTALLHESFHIIAIIISQNKMPIPYPVLNGLKIKEPYGLTYKKRILIYLFGPLGNIFVGLFFLPFYTKSNYLFTFGIINIATGISNLIPIDGYDGYNIMTTVFEAKGNFGYTRILNTLSFYVSIIAVFISIYFIGKVGVGYWFFIIFFCVMIKNVKKYNNSDVF